MSVTKRLSLAASITAGAALLLIGCHAISAPIFASGSNRGKPVIEKFSAIETNRYSELNTLMQTSRFALEASANLTGGNANGEEHSSSSD